MCIPLFCLFSLTGDDLLTSTTYTFSRTAATYSYTSQNNYLSTLAYGNGDSVKYTYNTQGQGDVTAIVNTGGTAVVKYTYDAWGKLLSTTGSMAGTLGAHNPLRYRGYVYDVETGLYYLQSRYYDPKIGRFINGDALVSTGQGILGNNMFAYCNNNPVVHLDPSGTRIVGFGFQGEIQGGDTAAGIEIIIYFDEEVCDGDDFIIVVYGYAGYELSPSQLKGILKCADAVVLAYSLESAYQESLNIDDDDAFCQYLFDASIVEALRGCLNGVSLSGGLFVIDGKDGLFTCPEDYSGAFGAWNYTADIGTNSATLFVAESPSCAAVGIKSSKRIPGLLPGSATISPFSITYSRSYYSNPFVIYRGDFQ